MIDCLESVPLLGDPLEVLGLGYRQFLMERDSPHFSKQDANLSGYPYPNGLWVLPDLWRTATDGYRVYRCTFYVVAPESVKQFKLVEPGKCVVCLCQGRLIE